MPRLFVALPIPDVMAEHLALVRGGIEGARWVDPADYHVTMAFIGDVDNGTAQEAELALETAHAMPFTVEAAGWDVFGRPARAVHLRIANSPRIDGLQRAITNALTGAGLKIAARKFVPHITVGRLPKWAAGAVPDWLACRDYDGPKSFPADSFALYTARPGGGGPYHPRTVYPLGV